MALNKSGYTANLDFESNSQKKNLVEKEIPHPCSPKAVKMKVGSKFVQFIDKHFFVTCKLHKIFDRNIIKLSYCCMNNVI